MNAPTNPKELELQTVEFKLDGKTIVSYEGETILKAAKRHGIDIPHLCFKDGYRPDGNCRACVVEINGERTLAPSCCRSATPGMEVKANSERALKSQKLVLEMLLSDMPDEGFKWVGDSKEEELKNQHGELSTWAARMDVTVRPELKVLRREKVSSDISHPAMAVNLDACIQCNRCVRACREEQVNDVIGYAMRGAQRELVLDVKDPLGESSCGACGAGVQA
jgi:formate dehydrogenase major subunit